MGSVCICVSKLACHRDNGTDSSKNVVEGAEGSVFSSRWYLGDFFQSPLFVLSAWHYVLA